MRVLVCGGRAYTDYAKVRDTLDDIHAETPINFIIEGEQRGADLLAWRWAFSRNVNICKYPANWKQFGRAAGPIRNQQMLDEGNPDLVVAFPGGSGTADMVVRANLAGVKVMEVL